MQKPVTKKTPSVKSREAKVAPKKKTTKSVVKPVKKDVIQKKEKSLISETKEIISNVVPTIKKAEESLNKKLKDKLSKKKTKETKKEEKKNKKKSVKKESVAKETKKALAVPKKDKKNKKELKKKEGKIVDKKEKKDKKKNEKKQKSEKISSNVPAKPTKKTDSLSALAGFLSKIKADQMKDVLDDLLTEKEIKEFNERVEILTLLKKKVPQRQIAKELGISVTTVSRGSKVFQSGNKKIIKYL